MPNGTTVCDRCKEEFGPLDDMRFRAGRFSETLPDGTVRRYEHLCEDCHREVVRERD